MTITVQEFIDLLEEYPAEYEIPATLTYSRTSYHSSVSIWEPSISLVYEDTKIHVKLG